MAEITFKGNPVHTAGDLPAVGGAAPEFSLTDGTLAAKTLSDYAGKKKVLNIVPSLDTPVCLQSARRFNQEVGQLENAVVLNISADLPFAQGRVCESEGIKSVESLSTFRSPSFGSDYGVVMVDGPLKGLLSRVVIVLDENDLVVYSEQVPEIAQEPDYAAALEAVKG